MNQLPQSLKRYEPLLVAAIRRDIEGSRSRPRQLMRLGRGLALRTATVGLTAVLAITALTLTGTIGNGPFIQKAAAAQAAAVLNAAPAEGVFHLRIIGTQTNSDGSVVSWENETWWATADPVLHRSVERNPSSGTFEWGTDGDGVSYLYEAATNTIFQAPKVTMQAEPAAEPEAEPVTSTPSIDKSLRTEILVMLESGAAVEDGREVVDGRDAIRIASSDGRAVYVVDSTTFNPIEWRTTGDEGTSSLRFGAYETLPGTPENLALLDLRTQHPDATLDADPDHFRDATARLFETPEPTISR